MTDKITLGIEIECILNSQIHGIDRGDYHAGIPVIGLSGFTAERDGSLSGREFNSWSLPVEFVSPVYHSFNSFKKSMNSFENFISKKGIYELDKVISFNGSCGSHIHIGIPNFYFKKKAIFEIFARTRRMFFKKLEESQILSDSTKHEIKHHYFRSMAKKMNSSIFYQNYSRYIEFNLTSEYEEKGIEWRSINLKGIKNWEEFREIINIFILSIQYLYKLSQKYRKYSIIKISANESIENNITEGFQIDIIPNQTQENQIIQFNEWRND